MLRIGQDGGYASSGTRGDDCTDYWK